MVKVHITAATGVCKYYIGPIGDLSVDCHSRRLGIDRQCTNSVHRNDMAYCHFQPCRDCGLGCLDALVSCCWLINYGGCRWWRVAVVFLYQITVFYNKTQQHHFWNFILMTQCKLRTRRRRRWQSTKRGRRWGRCSIYRHRSRHPKWS